jgi:galactokinase
VICEQNHRLASALKCFLALYGDGKVEALRAPARINILGEHIDYVSYLPTSSLAFGSHEHAMLMLFRPSGEARICGASTLDKFPPFSFALDEEAIEDHEKRSWESFVFNHPAPPPHWSGYIRGAVNFARWKYGARIERGFDFLIESTIPPQSGASSSSALVTLAGAAIRRVNQIDFNPDELARDSSQAEWFMGTRGGALDHKALCLAQRGHAVHISHWNQSAELISLPDDGFRWITFFSHKADKGREVMMEYNERAAVSRLLIPAMLASHSIEDLPDTIKLSDVSRLSPKTFDECRRAFPALVSERRDHPLKLRDRARHHSGEITRVASAVKILAETSRQTDVVMRELGQLVNESHASLRDLYEVSTPEVECLMKIIAADPYVYGARLMGGGFGGNVLALTTSGNAQSLIDRAQKEFYGPRGRDGISEGSVMVSTPGNGLEMIRVKDV